MRRYLDTSIVVSFVVHEIHTPVVRDWLKQDVQAENIISEWTITEFHSALSLKLRTGQISAEIKSEAEAFLRQAQTTIFKSVLVSNADFARASGLAADAGLWLRAGDALNLAIAERLEAMICTADKRLFKAAEQIGLAAYMP